MTADTSDGIVGRLRAGVVIWPSTAEEAAAHIEALEAKVERLQVLLDSACGAINGNAQNVITSYAREDELRTENARLREALESLTDASYQDTCDGSRPCWDVAARALLTDTEETT